MKVSRPPVWITGIGCISGAGIGRNDAESRLLGEGASTGFENLLDPGESRFFKLRLEEKWYSRFPRFHEGEAPNLLALLAIEDALDSAGLDAADLRRLRVGICLGSTTGGLNSQEAFGTAYNTGKLPDPAPLMEYFRNNSAQFIARELGLCGPTQLVNNACTSGADAIGIGANWLNAGLCDVVVCGGTEIILMKIWHGFTALMLCSERPCRPFDRNRDGLTLGDGAGVVVLEKAGSPRRPLAVMLGYGCGSDAYHPTTPHPQARGLGLATRTALAQAGLSPEAVDFINVHGTATRHNDLAEGGFIAANFPRVRVVATKGVTGHTLGAAGGLEAVFTVLSLAKGRLPISRGFSEADPEIGIEPTRAIEEGNYGCALSFSLGFGGINSVLCLGRTP
jgi:3-oxoacyl-[acyl-carrier-protein] synthase-1/3-oxoacyl-[acyl-carrier-protein] synthase II